MGQEARRLLKIETRPVLLSGASAAAGLGWTVMWMERRPCWDQFDKETRKKKISWGLSCTNAKRRFILKISGSPAAVIWRHHPVAAEANPDWVTETGSQAKALQIKRATHLSLRFVHKTTTQLLKFLWYSRVGHFLPSYLRLSWAQEDFLEERVRLETNNYTSMHSNH